MSHCYRVTYGIMHCISRWPSLAAWWTSFSPPHLHKLTFPCWRAVKQSVNPSIHPSINQSINHSLCTRWTSHSIQRVSGSLSTRAGILAARLSGDRAMLLDTVQYVVRQEDARGRSTHFIGRAQHWRALRAVHSSRSVSTRVVAHTQLPADVQGCQGKLT